MYSLFLDLSFENGVCALYLDSALLFSIVMPSREFITPHLQIEALLRKCNIKICDISISAVANGPGSYTGLRNAVAVIKALAYSFPSLQIVPISSLIGYLPAIEQLRVDKKLSIILIDDAKIGGIYVQKVCWSCGILQMNQPELIHESDLEMFSRDVDILSSYRSFSWLCEKIKREDLFEKEYIQTTSFNFAAIHLAIVESIKENDAIEKGSWQNIKIDYLRKTQAELELLKKRS